MQSNQQRVNSVILHLNSIAILHRILPIEIILVILREFMLPILDEIKEEMLDLQNELRYWEDDKTRVRIMKQNNQLADLTEELIHIEYFGIRIVSENTDFIKSDIRYEIPPQTVTTGYRIVPPSYLLVLRDNTIFPILMLNFVLLVIVVMCNMVILIIKFLPWLILFASPLLHICVIVLVIRKFHILVTIFVLMLAIYVISTVCSILIINVYK
jgi:hypothetical protein